MRRWWFEFWWGLTSGRRWNVVRRIAVRRSGPIVRQVALDVVRRNVVFVDDVWMFACPYTGSDARERFAEDLADRVMEEIKFGGNQ